MQKLKFYISGRQCNLKEAQSWQVWIGLSNFFKFFQKKYILKISGANRVENVLVTDDNFANSIQ